MVYFPDKFGHYGKFGGRFIPETLMSALDELATAYDTLKKDEKFVQEFNYYLKYYAGRPNPLYFASRLTEKLKGAKIYLKREDLNHTGAHKINNTIGQLLLARVLGKKKVIAETGAGQHGVATATVAAKFGLQCKIFMGAKDVERQALNVYKMKLLGAEVVPVTSGSQTLKDATNEAFRYWMANVKEVYYVIGSVVGPHPYPEMVRDFQSIIGYETYRQIYDLEKRLPDYIVACVGGGSNAMGIFYPFIKKPEVKLIGVEAAGDGVEGGRHSASLSAGKPGIFQGSYSYLLQDEHGQILEADSIAPGLDYPGVGPEHSMLKEDRRVTYTTATNQEALDMFKMLSETEGIIPALESSHALAEVRKLAPTLDSSKLIVVCLSGRGDKDLTAVEKITGAENV